MLAGSLQPTICSGTACCSAEIAGPLASQGKPQQPIECSIVADVGIVGLLDDLASYPLREYHPVPYLLRDYQRFFHLLVLRISRRYQIEMFACPRLQI